MTEHYLPCPSLPFRSPARWRDIADELGRSFAEFGFAVVRDHGIPADLIARGGSNVEGFFALPDDVKRAYKIEGGGGARGYTPVRHGKSEGRRRSTT